MLLIARPTFLFTHGCAHCAAVEAELARLRLAHAFDVRYLGADLGTRVIMRDYNVRGTPSLILPDRRVLAGEGLLINYLRRMANP